MSSHADGQKTHLGTRFAVPLFARYWHLPARWPDRGSEGAADQPLHHTPVFSSRKLEGPACARICSATAGASPLPK